MEVNMFAAMVTGHRKLVPADIQGGSPWPDQNPLVKQHHENIRNLMMTVIKHWHMTSGYVDFISGMALGADTLWAEAVINCKNSGLPIRLIAAVPFKGQESRWTAAAQQNFRFLIDQADHVEIVSPGAYSARKMQIRNVWMVEHSLPVLAVWDGTTQGGTWNCIKYALQQSKWVVQLHSQTLQLTEYKA
jgi:uncharacterized phage-like protein YoqJ